MRARLSVLVAATLACVALLSRSGHGQAPQLGTIDFPTSGAPAAQPAFIEGVKDLHSFEFDEAAVAFKKAQQADPSFALAYWGEAMSYNHPLWAQVDVEAAKTALGRLAPTLEARLAKAKTPKEKAFVEAIDRLFYTPGDKLVRDQAYSRTMEQMNRQWPDDHEVTILYALSLLGTVRPGDTGFRRQALAASLAEKVFKENPNHPGAAHFIIHAFDDPDHAPLALPAARAYAKIAPAAPHALHMPSHIFVQLGMWDDVAASNSVAYKAATDLIARMHLPEGREDFHTLSWLEYANLMLGKFDRARQNVELAKEAADRNHSADSMRSGYLAMRARYILETGQWERIPVDEASSAAGSDEHASMPGMTPAGQGGRYNGSAAWIFIAGFSAAKLGDVAAADRAAAQLRTMAAKTESAGTRYDAKPVAIMARELTAVASLARGNKEEAVRAAKEAVDIEQTLSAPSGPPDPIKPSLELYGDVLLEAGRPQEAAPAYDQQLLRTPNRTPSVKGLARAKPSTSTTVSDAR